MSAHLLKKEVGKEVFMLISWWACSLWILDEETTNMETWNCWKYRYKSQTKLNNRNENEMCEFRLCLIVFDKYLFILLSLFCVVVVFVDVRHISVTLSTYRTDTNISVGHVFFFFLLYPLRHTPLTLTVNCVRCDEMIRRSKWIAKLTLLFGIHCSCWEM